MPIPSDFDTPGFSIKTAYNLVNACRAAYKNELGDWVVELALGAQAEPFQFGAMHGIVANIPSATLIAFRGTDNPENWLTDSEAVQIADPAYPGKVHQGFASALGGIWADLKGQLPPAAAGRPTWVTGHSLGAALATLASVRLQNEGYALRGIYTYVCPRVGNPDFYDGHEPVQYRFVNNNDLVPHVPLYIADRGTRQRQSPLRVQARRHAEVHEPARAARRGHERLRKQEGICARRPGPLRGHAGTGCHRGPPRRQLRQSDCGQPAGAGLSGRPDEP